MKSKDNKNSYDRVLVLGSPGIGKSLFGWFLFLRAIKCKENVAYKPLDGETYYISWHNNGNDRKY